MVVTITRDGFIKRTTLETFRAQNRGGRGRSGASTRGDDIVTRSFHAHTHQWVLFFSSGGKVFREKVWRLPEAGPTAKGRALVNLLPELGSDTITTVLPLPQDETLWDSLHLRVRHRLGRRATQPAVGFPQRARHGPDRDEAGRGRPADRRRDLPRGTTMRSSPRAGGRCIRFQLSDDTVRVFAGRDSSGVRGIRLADGDEVISLSVLRHVKASNEERAAYLRQASAKRRGNGDDETEAAPEPEETVAEVALDEQRIAQLEREEDFLLTVTDAGLRQAHVRLRVPGDRPRRTGDCQYHPGAT